MFKNRNALLFLVMIIIWNACWGASLISLYGHSDLASKIYYTQKMHGIHLPLLLNMNLEQRGELCDRMIESDFLRKQGISKLTFSSPEKIMLLVAPAALLKDHFENGDFHKQRISPLKFNEIPIVFNDGSTYVSSYFCEIMIECIAVHQNRSGLLLTNFYVFYGYIPQNYFISRFEGDEFTLLGYGELSPSYVSKTHEELEKHFWRMRYHIGLTCEDYTDIQEQYVDMSLEFLMPDLSLNNGLVFTRSILCIGKQNEQEVRRYLTQTYDDENSVFVQKEYGSALILEAYIKDIPVLNIVKGLTTRNALEFELL